MEHENLIKNQFLILKENKSSVEPDNIAIYSPDWFNDDQDQFDDDTFNDEIDSFDDDPAVFDNQPD